MNFSFVLPLSRVVQIKTETKSSPKDHFACEMDGIVLNFCGSDTGCYRFVLTRSPNIAPWPKSSWYSRETLRHAWQACWESGGARDTMTEIISSNTVAASWLGNKQDAIVLLRSLFSSESASGADERTSRLVIFTCVRLKKTLEENWRCVEKQYNPPFLNLSRKGSWKIR